MTSPIRDIGTDLTRFFLKEGLSPEEITEISVYVRYRDCAPGEVILAEGAINDRLYFLLEGSVVIVHDGERIARSDKAGDVLGEMSLIMQTTTSASIVAENPVVLLVLDVTRLSWLSLSLQVTFANALNRLFSQILSVRLTATNEKARLFEITNRELQIAKKALESASAEKIDELSSNQRLAFRKLDGVLQQEVVPIRDELQRLEARVEGENKAELATIAARFQRVFSDLEPLVRNFQEAGSLRDRRVLLVEDDIDEQINAKMSLGGTGVDFNRARGSRVGEGGHSRKAFRYYLRQRQFRRVDRVRARALSRYEIRIYYVG